MVLITKKEFIETIREAKEFYFLGCTHQDEYPLERLKKIIDGATHEQLTYDKRYLIKINDYQMISKNKNEEKNYLQFKPFSKYYRDKRIYYITGNNATLIYYIKE